MLNSKHMRMRSWRGGVYGGRWWCGFQFPWNWEVSIFRNLRESFLEHKWLKVLEIGGEVPKDFLEIPVFLWNPDCFINLCKTLHLQSSICDLPNDAWKKKLPKGLPWWNPNQLRNHLALPRPGGGKQFLVKKWGKFFPPNFRGLLKNIQIFANKKHHGKLDLSETWPQTKKCRTKAGDLLDLLAGFLPGPTTLLLHHLKRMAKSAGFSPPATHGRSKEDTGFPQSLETTHPPQTRSTNIGGHSRNEMTTWWVINQWFLGEDGTSTVRISCCGPNFCVLLLMVQKSR